MTARRLARSLPVLACPLLGGAFAGALAAQDPATKPKSDPPIETAPATQQAPSITWKDLVKSGNPINVYGFLRMDAYYNTARMNSVILPQTVLPENGTTAKENDDQFALDPRLTRIGIDVKPGKVGETDVNLKLETDFANFPTGSAESRATPRIRVAWIDVAQEELSLRVGQDWDVVSPLFPAVNGELLMWNAGNTGDRRAQIQGAYKPADSSVDLRVSLGLTGAITNQDLDSPPLGAAVSERDGFDSGMPHLQMRAGFKPTTFAEDPKKPVSLGVWGMVGRAETDVAFGGEQRFDTWLGGADFTVPFTNTFTLRGEAWIGENLGDVRGGIGQTINTATGDEVGSIGGWAEFVYEATKRTRFHFGAATDNPDNDDLQGLPPATLVALRNVTGYVGTVVDWESGLRTGFDVLYWETEWLQGIGNAVRFNLYFQYNF